MTVLNGHHSIIVIKLHILFFSVCGKRRRAYSITQRSYSITKAIDKTDSITQNMVCEQEQVYLTDLVDGLVTPTPQVAG